MKILHTSDWHIGQNFMGQSRADEHSAFFLWLYELIIKEDIEVLIVSGDIFDTGNPPNYALEIYYNFLKKLLTLANFYVIITAGNHDSISTLKAPKELLEFLNIFVITSGDETEDELIPIYKDKILQGVVCAVPFLRDSVVRHSISGQTVTDKENQLNIGMKQHYTDIYDKAIKFIDDKKLPIIATGHLTTVGSRTSDSERDIYIGGTLDIGSDFLGKYFDYVALGHLHINQIVGVDHVRYSGSPIPLSFSESKQQKKVNIVQLEDDTVDVQEIDIPLQRELIVIKGDMDKVLQELDTIKDPNYWIEIHLKDDNAIFANQTIREYAQELNLIILAIKIDRSAKSLKAKELQVTSLEELTPKDVFKRRLDLDNIDDDSLKEQLEENFNLVYQEVLS